MFLKEGDSNHFLLKHVTNTELKRDRLLKETELDSLVLFHLLLILLLNLICIINPGSGKQNVPLS